MPFYDYKCSNPECNHIEVDVWEKPSDDKFPHVCPVCEDFAMLRQMGDTKTIKYELCQYLPVREFGYGWVAIETFDLEEEAIKAKESKEKPSDYLVRKKRIISGKSLPGITFKNLPKGHNLSATERRRLFNSNDPKEFKQIM